MQQHGCPLSARFTQPLIDYTCFQSFSYMIGKPPENMLDKNCLSKPGMLSLQEKKEEAIITNTAPSNINITMTENLGTSRKKQLKGVVCKKKKSLIYKRKL